MSALLLTAKRRKGSTMGKETYLAHTITQTDYEARYDRAAKKLLANKLVLAHILKDCVKEYQACSIMDIAQKYIEGEPEVGTTGVYMDDSSSPEQPDIKPETVATQSAEVQAMNAHAMSIQAMNTQVTKVQGMGNEDISAQHGTVFTKSDYQKLRKVYSIWICVNPAKKFRNTITRYSLKPETIIGNAVEAPENYDLINIVMVCLGKMEEWNDNNLIKFLGVLFQNELSAREKKDILERDFNIPMTETFESEVDDMCNLSQGVAEEAMQKGLERGRQEGIEQGIEQGLQQGRIHALIELVNDGVLTIEKAAEKARMSVEEFKNAMKSANTQI